jgi:hypothetical protein
MAAQNVGSFDKLRKVMFISYNYFLNKSASTNLNIYSFAPGVVLFSSLLPLSFLIFSIHLVWDQVGCFKC